MVGHLSSLCEAMDSILGARETVVDGREGVNRLGVCNAIFVMVLLLLLLVLSFKTVVLQPWPSVPARASIIPVVV